MEDTTALLPGTSAKARHRLTVRQKAAYGVGHVLNDICAAMWFSYTLLFFTVVLDMSAPLAGALLMIGQIADAVATPIVGVYADRVGSRKTWHLIGTMLLLATFPLMFSLCPGCELPVASAAPAGAGGALATTAPDASSPEQWIRGLYYSVLIIVFQTGWAIVQISHLALIPDLTPIQDERAELTAIRYTASMCSSVLMYLVTWMILHVTAGSGMNTIGPGDSYKFRDIVLIGIAVGGAFAACFHFVLKPPRTYAQTQKHLMAKQQIGVLFPSPQQTTSFHREPALYLVSVLYVASRLFLTLSLMYMPLYLAETLGEQTESLATVPLVSYIASFLTSIAVKYSSSCITSKMLYLLGGITSVLPCVWIGIGLGFIMRQGELYIVAVFIGAGSSLTVVSSLCYTADLIGCQTQNGAFVYSVVTFADKLLNGFAVMIIQSLQCTSVRECPNYYRDVLSWACGGCAVCGLLALGLLWKDPLGNHIRQSNDQGISPTDSRTSRQ